MPVVIDEVVISVEVTNAAPGGTASPPSGAGGKEEIVNACVEQVLDILRQRGER